MRAAYLGSVPLATGWILVVKHSMVLESERPQEIAKEAETELEDAELLVNRTKVKKYRQRTAVLHMFDLSFF